MNLFQPSDHETLYFIEKRMQKLSFGEIFNNFDNKMAEREHSASHTIGPPLSAQQSEFHIPLSSYPWPGLTYKTPEGWK